MWLMAQPARCPAGKTFESTVNKSSDRLLDLAGPWPTWLYFVVVISAILLVAIAALVWVGYLRRNPRRRRKRRHRHRRSGDSKVPGANPTLAQTGGLPPVREQKQTSRDTP